MRIALCNCVHCPAKDAGFTPESYRGPTLCLGPWLITSGSPARLLACQFRTEAEAERWARDRVGARLH
jgi:hypothetical protein